MKATIVKLNINKILSSGEIYGTINVITLTGQLIDIEIDTKLQWLVPYLCIDRVLDKVDTFEYEPLNVLGDKLIERIYYVTKKEHIEPAAEVCMIFSKYVNGHLMALNGYKELVESELKHNMKLNDEQRGMLYSKQILKTIETKSIQYSNIDWISYYKKKHIFLDNTKLLNEIKEYPDEKQLLSINRKSRGSNN